MTSNKEQIAGKKAQLMQLATDFSKEYLTEEYDVLIEKLISKMARKRDVPFMSGKIEIWAAAVIHALGTINFLFDKDSEPYVSVHDICDFFGTKQSTTTQRSKQIKDMFKLSYFNSDFSTESNNQSNPMNNFIEVNGFLVPQDFFKKK